VVEVIAAGIADFLSELRNHWNECTGSTGQHCPYEFAVTDDQVVQGCAWISENDPPEMRAQRAALATQFSPLTQAIRGLTPDEFESLGAGVLGVIGVRDARVTKRSQDEGIDFFGKLHMSDFLLQNHALPNVEKQLEVWVIGQAKHYVVDPVGTGPIRELVGSCALARAGVWPIQGETYSKSIQVRQHDPVYALMITCGQFSQPAWRLMATAGVIGMDGPMLAQLLALSGQFTGANNDFDGERFSTWLAEQEGVG
jgi:hypothetical protein